MDTQTIQAGLVIVGFVNGMRLLQEKSYWGFAFFAASVFVGIVLGSLHYFGLTVETGIVAGLGASGLYRIGEKVGGQ